jgi:hypothetical protein
MKLKKTITTFLKANSIFILLLCLSLNVFSADNSFENPLKSNISTDFDFIIHTSKHQQYSATTNSITDDFVFELEEEDDTDDDDKISHHNHSFITHSTVSIYDARSGALYLKSFLFFEKTPLFILYKNFKDFLS